MIKDFLAASAPLNMEIYGLIVFTIVFAVIGLWTFRKSGKKIYEDLSLLPLKEIGSDHD
jgi:cbb3-type cytochrome oxidase subunit 3